MGHKFLWIDIPVLDLDRAIRFYSAVLGEPVKKDILPSSAIGVLPHADGEVSGCLFKNPNEKPSGHGPLIYLNCSGRLEAAIQAAKDGGGKVLQGLHSIGPYGSRAIIEDSEGNRLALHSDSN